MQECTQNYIAVVGGACLDVHAKSLDSIRLRDSNPSAVHSTAGGVGRNIAENLARLGAPVSFLSAVGDDLFGRQLIAASEAAGVNMDKIHISPTFPTATYLALIDSDGDMFVGASDFTVLDGIPDSYFEQNRDFLQNASAVVADLNFSVSQLESLVSVIGDVPLFLDPVSVAKSDKALVILPHITMIKPNIYELERLSGLECRSDEDIVKACSILRKAGCRTVVVSLGGRGCCCCSEEGTFFRRIDAEAKIADATGAGDAFMAAFVYAYHLGLPLRTSVDYGLAAGFAAVESPNSINTDISEDLLKNILYSYSVKEGLANEF